MTETILQYKVMSYVTADDTQPYCHGYYDTAEVAQRVANDYNNMWASIEHKFYAKVEHE